MRQHDLAKSIFLQSLDIPASERSAFVELECRGDPTLHGEVGALLAFHDETLAGFPELTVTEIPPENVGGYRILGELGRGGMGVVYLARRDGEAEIALKVLKPALVSPTMLARFRREAKVLAMLDHPGIARLIDTGVDPTASGPRPWLAMDRIEGVNLAAWGRESRSIEERLEMLARVADAVEHAHGHEIVHRDLKPENVLVRADGRPVVLDFGVARLTDSDVRATTVMTSAGLIVGTIRYMSPEQAEGRPDGIGPRSDVYALGVLAYELLARRMPYEIPEHSVHRALVAVMTSPPGDMTELPAPIRGRMERVLRAALAKNPERRTASAGAFAADLRRVAAGRRPLARAPRGSGPLDAVPWRVVTALASGAALVGLVLSSWRTPPTPADWVQGLVQPGVMFHRVATAIDSVAVRLHYTTRTLEREREASDYAQRARSLVRTIGWRPYGARLERLALFRQGEAEYLIAERTNDVSRYETAATLWYESRERRFPAERGPLPDTIGPSAAYLLEPPSPASWLAASMALTDAARIASPSRLLDRALEYAKGAERALAQERATAGATGPPDGVRLFSDSTAVMGRLGRVWIGDGYHGGNDDQLLAGILKLREVRFRLRERRNAPSYASALHELGAGEARWACIRRDRAAAESALVHLANAFEIRSSLEGYTSRYLSRLELAQAHRLLARLDSTGGSPMLHLLAAERLLDLPPAEHSALPWIDARLFDVARAGVRIDLACVRHDAASLAALETGLVLLQRRIDSHRTPMLAVEAALQRARVAAQVWALTHSPREQQEARQSLDFMGLTLGNGNSYRWSERIGVASGRLDRPIRAYALDFPVPEPF